MREEFGDIPILRFGKCVHEVFAPDIGVGKSVSEQECIGDNGSGFRRESGFIFEDFRWFFNDFRAEDIGNMRLGYAKLTKECLPETVFFEHDGGEEVYRENLRGFSFSGDIKRFPEYVPGMEAEFSEKFGRLTDVFHRFIVFSLEGTVNLIVVRMFHNAAYFWQVSECGILWEQR